MGMRLYYRQRLIKTMSSVYTHVYMLSVPIAFLMKVLYSVYNLVQLHVPCVTLAIVIKTFRSV